MKKNILITALLAITLISCGKSPMSTEQTLNPAFELKLLFEHDGCKIYRFTDCGRYIYYTDCRGQTSWQTTKTVGEIIRTTEHHVNTEE